MIYALSAFALLCLAAGLWAAIDWHRMREERDAYNREALEWMRLYRGLRDDMPARDPKTGQFRRRNG